MSLTITLNGSSSELISNYFPSIILDGTWAVGLLNFESYHSIPNIDETKDCIVVDNIEIKLPSGCYELDDIESAINERIKPDVIQIKANVNTFKISIKCNKEVYFPANNSLRPLLGFEEGIRLSPSQDFESFNPVDIFRVSILHVDCNIATGSYLNNQKSHSIHEFFPDVEPGYKIIEIPKTVIYHEVTVKAIDRLVIRILDQNNKFVNFRGETITVRLHLKKIPS